MEKVKLTQEQADTIEDLKKKYSSEQIVGTNVRGRVHNRPVKLAELNLDTLIRALYIGYEIEETFEIGDWVYVRGIFDASPEVAKVTNVYANRIVLDNGFDLGKGSVTPETVRRATESETAAEKQRRWWANRYREVYEYRENDVVHCQRFNYEGIYIVESNEYGKDAFGNRLVRVFNRHVYDGKILSFDAKVLRIICFAEDRKDIKEEMK